jgi:hypothetical protein
LQLTLLLNHELEEKKDTLVSMAPGGLILVLPQQSQQSYLVAQHRGHGLFLGRVGQ